MYVHQTGVRRLPHRSMMGRVGPPPQLPAAPAGSPSRARAARIGGRASQPVTRAIGTSHPLAHQKLVQVASSHMGGVIALERATVRGGFARPYPSRISSGLPTTRPAMEPSPLSIQPAPAAAGKTPRSVQNGRSARP
jgi:hypothetical protein